MWLVTNVLVLSDFFDHVIMDLPFIYYFVWLFKRFRSPNEKLKETFKCWKSLEAKWFQWLKWKSKGNLNADWRREFENRKVEKWKMFQIIIYFSEFLYLFLITIIFWIINQSFADRKGGHWRSFEAFFFFVFIFIH